MSNGLLLATFVSLLLLLSGCSGGGSGGATNDSQGELNTESGSDTSDTSGPGDASDTEDAPAQITTFEDAEFNKSSFANKTVNQESEQSFNSLTFGQPFPN